MHVITGTVMWFVLTKFGNVTNEGTLYTDVPRPSPFIRIKVWLARLGTDQFFIENIPIIKFETKSRPDSTIIFRLGCILNNPLVIIEYQYNSTIQKGLSAFWYLGSRTFRWACAFMSSYRSTLLNQWSIEVQDPLRMQPLLDLQQQKKLECHTCINACMHPWTVDTN